MANTPTTPVASPSLTVWRAPSAQFLRIATALTPYFRAWLEPQDLAGRWSLGILTASTLQASIAIFIQQTGTAFIDYRLLNLYLPVAHFLAPWLWSLPLVFGLASGKRLANTVAWFTVASLIFASGWAWVPFGGHSLVTKAIYVAGGLIALAPAAVRLCKRFLSSAA